MVVVGGACIGVPAASVAASPTIDAQWVSNVTSSNATLHAEINPMGQITKYKLQIDTTGNFKFPQNDSCALHPPQIVCALVMLPGEPQPPGLMQPSEGTLSPTLVPQHVSVSLASIGSTLQPDTTYYYRAIAASGISFVFGPTQTFTTPAQEAIVIDPAPPEEEPEPPLEEPEEPPVEVPEEIREDEPPEGPSEEGPSEEGLSEEKTIEGLAGEKSGPLASADVQPRESNPQETILRSPVASKVRRPCARQRNGGKATPPKASTLVESAKPVRVKIRRTCLRRGRLG